MTDIVNKEGNSFEEKEKEGVFAVTENFGMLLRHYRTRVKDITLKELSEASQLSESYINRLENGERKAPTVTTAMRLADALDIPISVLTATIFQRTEGEIQNTLSDVLIQNNYAINDRALSKNAKEILVNINEFIIECKWGPEKVKDLFLLSEMLDDLKEAI